MILKFSGEIGVGNAIAISHAEVFSAAKILAGGLSDPAAGHAFESGVGESDFPVEVVGGFMDDNLVGLELDGAVAVVEVEVAEVVYDVFSLEAEAEDEAFETMPGVKLHDVPQNGMVADGDHGLG